MTADNRILICSYNRRRTRSSENNDESTMQTSKSKPSALKSRIESQQKHMLVSENISRWSSADNEVRTPAPDTESETSTKRLPIFRQRVNINDDDEDMFVLKRANPVYDSDDEDFICSPSKRQRTAEPTCLDWEQRLSECDVNGFTLSFSSVLHQR